MTTPDNPPAVSEAAKAKACELANAGSSGEGNPWTVDQVNRWASLRVFAGFIQEVSDAAFAAIAHHDTPGTTCTERAHLKQTLAPFILPEPVEPLLIEAREIAKSALDPSSHSKCRCPDEIDRGEWDDKRTVKAALNGLRRGMELARESSK